MEQAQQQPGVKKRVRFTDAEKRALIKKTDENRSAGMGIEASARALGFHHSMYYFWKNQLKKKGKAVGKYERKPRVQRICAQPLSA